MLLNVDAFYLELPKVAPAVKNKEMKCAVEKTIEPDELNVETKKEQTNYGPD